MSAVAKPDDEELEVLVTELSLAKKQLHTLLLHREYEGVEFKGRGTTRNLLEYLSRGQKDRREGKALEADLEATQARVAVLQRLYDDYQARHDAFMEGNTKQAADPE